MARHGRYGAVNPRMPEAAAVCDRGGEVVKRSALIREMRWAGKQLVPTGFLCCARHIDPPHPQDYALVLGPDPVPVRDPRPDIDPNPIAPAAEVVDDHGMALTDDSGAILTP
jgi:hypothetical protein